MGRPARRGQTHVHGFPTAGPGTGWRRPPGFPRAAQLRRLGGHHGSPIPPSPPPEPGGDAAHTHAGVASGRQRWGTRRWRRHAGARSPAAGPATRGARRPPWPRGRRAAEDKRRPPEAAPAHARPPCPAPRRENPDTRGPGKSAPEAGVRPRQRQKSIGKEAKRFKKYAEQSVQRQLQIIIIRDAVNVTLRGQVWSGWDLIWPRVYPRPLLLCSCCFSALTWIKESIQP